MGAATTTDGVPATTQGPVGEQTFFVSKDRGLLALALVLPFRDFLVTTATRATTF